MSIVRKIATWNRAKASERKFEALVREEAEAEEERRHSHHAAIRSAFRCPPEFLAALNLQMAGEWSVS